MRSIRDAVSADIPILVAMGRDMHQEGAFSAITFKKEKLASFLQWAISSPDYLVLVAEDAGAILGSFIASVYPYMFSDDTIAKEIALYVRPEHRGGVLAVRLIKAFCAWAESKGAAEIMAGDSMGVTNMMVRDLYNIAGFDNSGFIFKRRA